MIPVLTTYWPVIAGALALFLKPGEKPIWKVLVDTVVPSKPTPGTPNDILTMLPVLLDKLAKKPPTMTPAPNEPKVPSNLQDIVALILDQLATPETPIDHKDPTNGDIAHLLGCANEVAAKHPDSDVTITINASGVNAIVVKRAESK